MSQKKKEQKLLQLALQRLVGQNPSPMDAAASGSSPSTAAAVKKGSPADDDSKGKGPGSAKKAKRVKKEAAVEVIPPAQRPPDAPPLTSTTTVIINRAPVLVLWATVVAYRKTGSWPDSLSMGKAYADFVAVEKGAYIGLFDKSRTDEEAEEQRRGEGVREVSFMDRTMLVVDTEQGTLALNNDGKPCSPSAVQIYLKKAFKEHFDETCEAMLVLTESFADPAELERYAWDLYTKFRPEINQGTAGWGQKGLMALQTIINLAVKGGGGSKRGLEGSGSHEGAEQQAKMPRREN